MIIQAVTEGVERFDMKRKACLATDWSNSGIGFFLLQKYCQCEEEHHRCCNDGWKLVLAGGRVTNPAESRYRPVEGECLAVADALHKAKHYVLGCKDLLIGTDHKPLLGVFQKDLGDNENPRLLSIAEKTMWFKFKIIYVKRKLNDGPDYMSRQGGNPKDNSHQKEARTNICQNLEIGRISTYGQQIDDALVASMRAALIHSEGLRAVTFDRVKEATTKDPELMKLKAALLTTHYRDKLPEDLERFERYREGLAVLDNNVMYHSRVMVPVSLQEEVLAGLHAAHQGVEGMQSRAKETVFWPNITRDLEEIRARCRECNVKQPSQAPLPPRPLVSPDYPFQYIVADYCSIKAKTWLICADHFTGWVSVFYFAKEATVKELVKILREMFTTFGVSENLTTDDGSKMGAHVVEEFLTRWGVEHRISADYNPHANLRVESAVKTAKRMLMTNTRSDGSPNWDHVSRALLQHRNTPIKGLDLSPAQLLFGRSIKDLLPVKGGDYKPAETWITCREHREKALRHRVSLGGERWSEHTKSLPQLIPGQHVFIQNQRAAGNLAKRWDKTGVVLENMGFDKYAIKVDGSWRVTKRNRRYLRNFKTAVESQLLPGPRPDVCLPRAPANFPPTASAPSEAGGRAQVTRPVEYRPRTPARPAPVDRLARAGTRGGQARLPQLPGYPTPAARVAREPVIGGYGKI